jgi:hypothetical protein
MVHQGISLVNLTECEIRSIHFGPHGVEEWNLTLIIGTVYAQ